MRCELIRFETKDKLELQGLLYKPKEKVSKILIHVHGWTGNFYENRFIDYFADILNKNNVAFFTFNNRGAGIITEFLKDGERVRIGGSLEKFEDSLFDIGGAIMYLQTRGFQEFVLQGHSLGCQKIAYYQNNKKDNRVKGLILLAPVDDVEFVTTKLFNDTKYHEALTIAYNMIKNGKGQDPVPKWMQHYPLLSANMFIQVSDVISTSGRIFHYYGKLQEMKTIKAPILAIFGSKDDYQIKPKEKLEILKKKVGCNTYLVKNANHWFRGYEKVVTNKIISWINSIS
mgnify:CR=1 FL=1